MSKRKWPLVANTQISKYLKKSIVDNSVGGTYVFAGPDNLGKTTIAKFFAQVVLCQNLDKSNDEPMPCGACPSCRKLVIKNNNVELEQGDLSEIHGDFHIINKGKDKKNISISQIRDFIGILNLSSFGGNYKIGIIRHAESLSDNAANALLKTLEEPKDKIIVILITKDLESLPATICSRSQVLVFKPVKTDVIYEYLVDDLKIKREKARNIARLCLGRPALAVKFVEDNNFYNFYNEKAEAILAMQNKDINGRFQIIDSLLDKKVKGQEAVRVATRILEIWQGLNRDALLLVLGHNDIVQHIYLQDEIKKNRDKQNLTVLLNLSKALSSAHISLRANVNPRLVFEGIVLNI